MKRAIKFHCRNTALHCWHAFLSLTHQVPVSWHSARLREKLVERRAAVTSISRSVERGLTYTASKVYIFIAVPIGVLLYIVAKFSLRWAFYRIVAFASGARGRKLKDVREVVNPRKTGKVDEVAGRHGEYHCHLPYTLHVNLAKFHNVRQQNQNSKHNRHLRPSRSRKNNPVISAPPNERNMVRECNYYEGSEVIDSVVDGGLAAFKKLPHGDKQRHRASAVGQIGRDACHNGKSALVTGHFILPNDGIDGGLQELYTEADLETFTHIVYLKVPAEDIRKRCAADVQRKRALFPAEEMSKWHYAEVERLFHLCLDRYRLRNYLAMSMASMTFSNTQLERCSNILVFDADRTFAPQDSGTAMVFGGPLSYTHRVFQQVSVLLESFECFNETSDSICDAVTNKIIVYPEITNILSRAARDPRYPMEAFEVPIYIAPSTAAKLLASPMRDASIEGLTLQDARVQTGRFLATQVVTEVICLEKHTIPHLQGQNTSGYRFKNEKRKLIVAIMRGGEPMAKGVYKTFPLARYAFAKSPQNIAWRDVADMANILLVDSVINTGKSMIDFVENIRTISFKAKILFVAGI
ncbi:hypothetical protein MCOR29_009064 [Pyricularia oryzae]|nr:hypothetical protein MCOR29_009064 [Pyricularia oryzae]